MFSLTYLGHAGWICEKKDFKCAFDPWFGQTGAFLDQWYPFPENTNLTKLDTLSDLDFLYISHSHEDHVNKETLEHIDRSTIVLIPKFQDKTLLCTLEKIGFKNIKELTEEDQFLIKGVKVRIFKEEAFIYNDSAIFLEDESSKILNLNDCHYDYKKLKELTGPVDLLLLQTSSANYWPGAYSYSEETMRAHGRSKRKNALIRAAKYAQTLKSRMTIPNAGPPIFKNRRLKKWNLNRREDWNPFCPVDDSCNFLVSEGLESNFLLPLDKIFVSKEITFQIDEQKREEVYGDLDSYTEKYLDKLFSKKQTKQIFSDMENRKSVDKFLKQIKKISKISKFYTKMIDFPIVFDFATHGKWLIDFATSSVVQEYSSQKYGYYFQLDASCVSLIFQDQDHDFEKYFLGCNFTCSRSPDTYNEYLFTLLKNFDTKRFLESENLYAKVERKCDELFILHQEGVSYEVQKYCPHMFADLEAGGYVDEENNLVCPLHNWKFSLKNGECTNKKGYSIKVKKLD